MKYRIEFELPDNDTVLEEIKTAFVTWSVWGYTGYTIAKPVRNEAPNRGKNFVTHKETGQDEND